MLGRSQIGCGRCQLKRPLLRQAVPSHRPRMIGQRNPRLLDVPQQSAVVAEQREIHTPGSFDPLSMVAIVAVVVSAVPPLLLDQAITVCVQERLVEARGSYARSTMCAHVPTSSSMSAR